MKSSLLDFPPYCSGNRTQDCAPQTSDLIMNGEKLLRTLSPIADEDNDRTYNITEEEMFEVKSRLVALFRGELSRATLQTPFMINAMPATFFDANDGNVPRTMDMVTRSVSNHFRDSANRTIVEGVALASVSCIHVQWPWLVLPLALVVLAAAFLCMCIASSANGGLDVWKSSSIAQLYHGLAPLMLEDT